ncbi:6532_t:CDS:1, partial [Funneliformis geosporum]
AFKKNPNIAHVHSSTIVECICEKRIVLYKDYEETNLTKHLQNGCNLKNKQPGITSFFNYTSKLDTFNEFDEPIELPVIRKPCQDLSGRKYQQYIERTPVEVEGIQQREVIAKDLFPITSEYCFNHLSKGQKLEFNQQFCAEAKWIIDQIGNYIL